MKHYKNDFGSSYPDDALFDMRVDYMQPSMKPFQTQDHLERELREEIENVSMDNGDFYYDGDQSDDSILDEKENSSYNSDNAPKMTLTQAMNKSVDPEVLANKAKISLSMAKEASQKAASKKSIAEAALAHVKKAKDKAASTKVTADKAIEYRNAVFAKAGRQAMNGTPEDEAIADAAQIAAQKAIADANAAAIEVSNAQEIASRAVGEANVALSEASHAQSISSQAASIAPSKVNKPLLIGAAAGIAALLYFNKG